MKTWSDAMFELPILMLDACRAHHAIFDPVDPMPMIGTYLNVVLKRIRRPKGAQFQTRTALR